MFSIDEQLIEKKKDAMICQVNLLTFSIMKVGSFPKDFYRVL